MSASGSTLRRLKRILLAYDGFSCSQGVPEPVVGLADRQKATLHLLHVVQSASRHDSLTALKRDALEALAGDARMAGVEARSKIRFGAPRQEIAREAAEVEADLLVLALDAGRPLGPTATRLVQRAPCAVWLHRPECEAHVRRVLATVSLAPAGSRERRLDMHVLELGSLLARHHFATLYLVNVWELPGEQLLRRRKAMTKREIDRLVHHRCLEQAAQLNHLDHLEWTRGLEVRALLERGRPEDVIPRVVDRHRIDLLVLGLLPNLLPNRIAGFLMSNSGNKIYDRVPCSIVAVQPRPEALS